MSSVCSPDATVSDQCCFLVNLFGKALDWAIDWVKAKIVNPLAAAAGGKERKTRKRKYSDVQCETCVSVMEDARADANLRSSLNTRVTRKAAFERYRARLARVGVMTFAMFCLILNAVQERNYEERKFALENVQNAAETTRNEQKADVPETSANVGFDVQKATLNDIIGGVMNGVETCLRNWGARMSAQAPSARASVDSRGFDEQQANAPCPRTEVGCRGTGGGF